MEQNKTNTIISNKEQVVFSRKVYLVQPKEKLLKHLERIAESQSADLFQSATVVMTDAVDYERYLEGWGIKLIKTAKETFIQNLFGEFAPFLDEYEMANVLGDSSSYVELFDRWFTISEVEYLTISKDWKNI